MTGADMFANPSTGMSRLFSHSESTRRHHPVPVPKCYSIKPRFLSVVFLIHLFLKFCCCYCSRGCFVWYDCCSGFV